MAGGRGVSVPQRAVLGVAADGGGGLAALGEPRGMWRSWYTSAVRRHKRALPPRSSIAVRPARELAHRTGGRLNHGRVRSWRGALTVVPFLWAANPDSAILDITSGMAADPENHEILWVTRTLLPVGDLEASAHEPVLTTTNHAGTFFGEMMAIRALERGTGHWMAMISGPVDGPGGFAYGNRLNYSQPHAETIAHELGHNMSLWHAPCGDPSGPDPSYPYSDGSIGAWGYDFRDGGRLVNPSTPDLMSYCHPRWISDYDFTNALRFRLFP